MRNLDLTIIARDGASLAGTLSVPDGHGPHPAVLLLHGSGRLDRDGNAGRLKQNLGPVLAESLARRGIASVRYDRRGVGASSGDWLTTGFADNREDAVAAVDALTARPDIGRVGVIGHSEGALHAMALGSHPGVAAVVLLAGFARSGEDAMLWQAEAVARGLPAPLRPLARLAIRRVIRLKAPGPDVVRVAGKRVNARWTREMLAHDTRTDLARVRVPVLAVTGEKDIQVDPDDLRRIHALVQGEAEVRRVPELTHLLRRDPGRASMLFYPRQLRQPVDDELIRTTTSWLARALTLEETE
ncbi:alpha/beta hydrolase [Lentzea cavernae]|uniref:Acyl-CoA thioester hydrolase n=1 Tax=Lentzea cavernae TaxID=2020703 RepID=A0ABQ3M236_9PSEU|nr:alpha/beta fold hydrolase [Lentzea cavernae]GHH31442.1 acyl-CoA thioester hydrolase [Lentzea cavernae]